MRLAAALFLLAAAPSAFGQAEKTYDLRGPAPVAGRQARNHQHFQS